MHGSLQKLHVLWDGRALCSIHTYVGSDHFWGFKILIFNTILGFQKNEYFLGMYILWILFWGDDEIGLVLGVNFMYLRVFT